MKAIILKCKGNEQYRFGSGSKDSVSNLIYSDTLFSALINVYNKVYDDCSQFLELFINEKVNISSAFPVWENIPDKSYIYFIPKPVIEFSPDISEVDMKSIKKIRFISTNVFNLMKEQLKIENEFPVTSLNLNDNSRFSIIDGSYCILNEEIKNFNLSAYKPISNISMPKVFVNTIQTTDKFYYETNIMLNTFKVNGENLLKPHFYFLINDNELKSEEFDKIITCFRILCDEGIGGERSTGKGAFQGIEIIDKNFKNDKSELYISLSLINPANDNEFKNVVFYDLIKRGGGSLGNEEASEYHRKQVKMISEGAIIKNQIKGRIVDVSPDKNIYSHKIYRYGKAFLLPLGGLS